MSQIHRKYSQCPALAVPHMLVMSNIVILPARGYVSIEPDTRAIDCSAIGSSITKLT